MNGKIDNTIQAAGRDAGGDDRIVTSTSLLLDLEAKVSESSEEALKLSILIDHFFGLSERGFEIDGRFSISSAEAAMLFGQACETRDAAEAVRVGLQEAWSYFSRGGAS